jgi:hypothetical protein
MAWGLPIEPSPELGWLLKQLGPGRDRRRAAREKLAELAGHWCEERSSRDHASIANGSDHIEQSNGNAGHSNGQPVHPHHLAHAPLTTHGSAELAEVHSPLTCLAWLHLLVSRPELFSAELWWQVCSRLLEVAQRQGAGLESDPLGHQLWAGELPLTLAALLPEFTPCRDLRGPATAALTLGIAEILDGEGLPHSRYLDEFQSLVACWSRCHLIADHLEGGCWNEAAEAQFPLALREAVRLNFGSGIRENSAWVETRNSHKLRCWLSDLVQDLTTDKPTRRLIDAVVGKRRTRHKMASKPQRLPAPAVHSEWAELAILRTDWSRRAAQLTIAYAEQAVRMQLTLGAESLIVGQWGLDVRADGNLATPTGGWREVCWVSDDDGDYLELEIELSQSLRVQRQFLLAREDRFLFLADAILGEQSRELSYCGHLQMAGQIAASAAAETREMLLAGRKARALMLPLALPEWKSDSRGGALGVNGGALQLRQSCIGQRLYAPLWIDLSRRRADKPFTWRQLTVAEQRQILPRDEAAGYRIQFGRRQWLIYRSLTAAANRTVLGKNLSTDFLAARFGRDGETETIVEIE